MSALTCAAPATPQQQDPSADQPPNAERLGRRRVHVTRRITCRALIQALWRRLADHSLRAAEPTSEAAPAAIFVDPTGRRAGRWKAVSLLAAICLVALIAALLSALVLPTHPPASMYTATS